MQLLIQLQQAQALQLQQMNDNFAKMVATMEKGTLPAQAVPNPNALLPSTSNANMKQCKAVTTLRSGREIPNVEPPMQEDVVQEEEILVENLNPKEAKKTNEKVVVEEEEVVADTKKTQTKAATPYSTPAPFPQRLLPKGKDHLQKEIREVFSKCHLNIPLLDAIVQIPTYAKYLKDLCTVKRHQNVKKKVFLTEQVSSIVLHNTPTKYKDPGSPTIACTIGTKRLGNTLLDLGSSVNILPFALFEKIRFRRLEVYIHSSPTSG